MNDVLTEQPTVSKNLNAVPLLSNIEGKSDMFLEKACNDCACCVINKFKGDNPYVPVSTAASSSSNQQVITQQPKKFIADVNVISSAKVKESCNNCACCVINLNQKQQSQGFAPIG